MFDKENERVQLPHEQHTDCPLTVLDHLKMNQEVDRALNESNEAFDDVVRQKESEREFPIIEDPGLTDMGNATRFVAQHGAYVRYCHPWRKFLIWDGTRWAVDDSGQIGRYSEKTVRSIYAEAANCQDSARRKELSIHAKKSESEYARRAMERSIKHKIPVRPEELDKDGWLLNCENGTLDLRTGQLREHRREDFLTKLVPVKYDSSASCPMWHSFLSDIMERNQDLISYLQRCVGYALTGVIRDHTLFFLHGTGANGKSTFIGAIHDVWGSDYARSAPRNMLLLKHMDSHPTTLATLHGYRLVSTIETEGGRALAEALTKQLTGGDRIMARRMREDYWEYSPTHKIFLCANHRPIIRGQDHAIWRRIREVPFRVKIPDEKQDKELPDKLKEERPGILAWAVQGCRKWQESGLNEPFEVLAATDQYREEMDVLGQFIGDRCELGKDFRAMASDLYRAYREWAEENGEKVLSQIKFGTYLGERGFKRGRNRNERYWIGLRLPKPLGL